METAKNPDKPRVARSHFEVAAFIERRLATKLKRKIFAITEKT
jgi:hypothetical protein